MNRHPHITYFASRRSLFRYATLSTLYDTPPYSITITVPAPHLAPFDSSYTHM